MHQKMSSAVDLIWLCCVESNWSYNGQGSDGSTFDRTKA